jgi:hypothetical protein
MPDPIDSPAEALRALALHGATESHAIDKPTYFFGLNRIVRV